MRHESVTICLATFNRAPFLPRAIESVFEQTFPNWQLLIVDDGSTDESPQVLAEYAQRDPRRIVVMRQPNRGLVAARNAAIGLASGHFITFLDSDDEYLPSHLELRVQFMRDHPTVELIHGGVQIVGGPDTVPDIHDPSRLIPIRDCAVGGTFFFRAEALARLGGFRKPDFGCDHELLTRAARMLVIERVDFPTYVYHRDIPDSMCTHVEQYNRRTDRRE
jgi:glycosyltransferase involved in cell wall biosynthesis